MLTVEAGCQGTEAAAVTAEKLAIDFLAENFELVRAGEAFARADGETLVADD